MGNQLRMLILILSAGWVDNQTLCGASQGPDGPALERIHYKSV